MPTIQPNNALNSLSTRVVNTGSFVLHTFEHLQKALHDNAFSTRPVNMAHVGGCSLIMLIGHVDKASVTQCYLDNSRMWIVRTEPPAGTTWQQQLWTSRDNLSMWPDV